MKTSELIKLLTDSIRDHGDLHVYTNGEHGIGECELLHESAVTTGAAKNSFDDVAGLDPDHVVVHIGGY
jgi:hypothetical protein